MLCSFDARTITLRAPARLPGLTVHAHCDSARSHITQEEDCIAAPRVLRLPLFRSVLRNELSHCDSEALNGIDYRSSELNVHRSARSTISEAAACGSVDALPTQWPLNSCSFCMLGPLKTSPSQHQRLFILSRSHLAPHHTLLESKCRLTSKQLPT